VAQSVKCPTLDFGSGHDLGVTGLSPMSGSLLSWESASPFLSNKKIFKKRKGKYDCCWAQVQVKIFEELYIPESVSS